MGVLFANAEKMDIQLERKRTKEALEKLEEAEKREQKVRIDLVKEVERATKADERATKADENAEKTVKVLLETLQTTGSDQTHAMEILRERIDLSEEDAKEKIERYWK